MVANEHLSSLVVIYAVEDDPSCQYSYISCLLGCSAKSRFLRPSLVFYCATLHCIVLHCVVLRGKRSSLAKCLASIIIMLAATHYLICSLDSSSQLPKEAVAFSIVVAGETMIYKAFCVASSSQEIGL